MHHSQILAGKRERLFSILVSLGAAAVLPNSNCLAGGHEHGPIYRTLDALAGGIEKVIDVAAAAKHRSCLNKEPLCDDACDSMMMGELVELSSAAGSPLPEMEMVPMQPYTASPAVIDPSAPDSLSRPKPLMAPRIPTPPRDTPRVARPTPAPQPVPTPRSADDEWIESFSPQTPSPGTPTAPRRSPQTQPNSRPGARSLRSPAETYDSLPNPFLDDPQSSRARKSVNQPASYWEPW